MINVEMAILSLTSEMMAIVPAGSDYWRVKSDVIDGIKTMVQTISAKYEEAADVSQ